MSGQFPPHQPNPLPVPEWSCVLLSPLNMDTLIVVGEEDGRILHTAKGKNDIVYETCSTRLRVLS